jgi:hypothetical protein
MSLGLSVATEIVLTAGVQGAISDFPSPWFAQNQPCTTPQRQWNSFLSLQWCLLDASYGRIRVVGSCLLCHWGCQWPQKLCWLLGSIADFQPKFCLKSTLHHTVPVSYVTGAVSGHRKCADWWGPFSLLIFNPRFAQNQPCTTPQSQWNSFLSIQ